MMRKLALALVVFMLAAMLLSHVTTSTPYSPWCDLDDDGDIDIYDVVDMAGRYGETGNPTRNVNVTNWPIQGADASVWWLQFLDVGETKQSSFYNASGFGQLHLLAVASELTAAETLTVAIKGIMYDSGHTTMTAVEVSSFVLTSGRTSAALTLPVPSAEFQFRAETDVSTICYISLSFYLTWT